VSLAAPQPTGIADLAARQAGLAALVTREAGLAALAARQAGVFTRQQALKLGYSSALIATAVRRRTWLPCGFGAFCVAADCDPRYAYARHCAARVLRLSGDVVVSHGSAAVLLELPYVDPPDIPEVTRARKGVAEHRSGLYTAAVPSDQRLRSLGLTITNGPRTLLDLLRNAPDALVAQGLADGGLRAGISLANLAEVLTFCQGWPGIAQVRAALDFAEPRCESPLESRCRIWFRDGGLSVPTPQFLVRGRGGLVVARVDFCFEEQRVVVEADGRVKYRENAPWRRPNDATLWDEKLREDLVRDLGFQVVRARWEDGRDGGADLVRRVRRAMDRAALAR